MANRLKTKHGKRPLLVACDVYRPAAIEQLKIVGAAIEVPVYTEEGSKDPVRIAKEAIKFAKLHGNDVVIIDTAGRLAIDEQMMKEIEAIKSAVNPGEILFVVDSMTGQDAVNTAKEFNDRLNFDGVVLTKLDGDTRGGAALSIRSVVTKPIKFVGTGEKMDAIDAFYPNPVWQTGFLAWEILFHLLNVLMNNLMRRRHVSCRKRLAKDQFNFDDFLKQIQQIKKMGNLKDLASMIPGMGKAMKDIDIEDDAFKHIEAIIHSMTKKERADASIIDGSRRKRISTGSGTSIQEVNRLLKQFADTRKDDENGLSGR